MPSYLFVVSSLWNLCSDGSGSKIFYPGQVNFIVGSAIFGFGFGFEKISLKSRHNFTIYFP